MPGIWEILIVLLIVLLIFGTTKLKSLGSDLGSAIKGFKTAITDDKAKLESDAPESTPAESTQAETNKES